MVKRNFENMGDVIACLNDDQNDIVERERPVRE